MVPGSGAIRSLLVRLSPCKPCACQCFIAFAPSTSFQLVPQRNYPTFPNGPLLSGVTINNAESSMQHYAVVDFSGWGDYGWSWLLTS
ncbi:unnamed protein product [Mycena citricolor]|uniref:Uncharacterized protein n=1 Tax=Mycena citricolor TaxID=2018698 RepID=A0AAD2HSM7_9AGAR|nr:unnamed protein product [Mycena citricolor]